MRGAFSGHRAFLAFHSGNIHLCRFFSHVFFSLSLLYRTLVTFESSSYLGLLLLEVRYFTGAKKDIKSWYDCAFFLPSGKVFHLKTLRYFTTLRGISNIPIPPTVDRYTTDSRPRHIGRSVGRVPTDIPTDSVDRRSVNSNNMSTEYRPICRPSIEYRPTVGGHIGRECRPILGRQMPSVHISRS